MKLEEALKLIEQRARFLSGSGYYNIKINLTHNDVENNWGVEIEYDKL